MVPVRKRKRRHPASDLSVAKKIAHVSANGLEEFEVVPARRERRVVFVNQNDERSSFELTHPGRDLQIQIQGVVRAFESYIGKGGEQGSVKDPSKVFFVGKLRAIGKVETHHVVGSILPELFDGEPPEVAKAVPEERLQSGHEERFAETSGTYEKHGHERRCELAYQLRFVGIDGAASPEVGIVRLSQRKVGEEDRHTDVFHTDGYESGRTHIVAKRNLPKDFANDTGSVFPDWFQAHQSFAGQKHLRILFASFELMQKCLKFLSGKTSNAIFFLYCLVQKA